jgi:cytochrome c553
MIRLLYRVLLVLLVSFTAVSMSSSPAKASEASVDDLIQAALNLDAQPRHGSRLFAENCARCHRADASGDASRQIPALAGQRTSYLVKQFADFREGDRDSNTMHGVLRQAGLREPQAWLDLASWLNAQPRIRTLQHGDGAHLALGEAMYQAQCSSCHEADARGDDDGFIPSLRDQHYSYLLKQLQGFVHGRRSNVDENLVRYMASLEQDELQGVADYLTRFKMPERNRTTLRQNGVPSD